MGEHNPMTHDELNARIVLLKLSAKLIADAGPDAYEHANKLISSLIETVEEMARAVADAACKERDPFRCTACNRRELECSHAPCPAVETERDDR